MIKRYTREKMGNIWSRENRFSNMLEVEILACEAQSKLGKVPKQAVKEIRKKAKFQLDRIDELEKETKHDVVAFVKNVSENIGEAGKFIHLDLTSSDVLDTALGVQLKEAIAILIQDIDILLKSLANQARKYKNTPIIGRTHGVHAEPTTFGLKLTLFFDEMKRNLARLEQAKQAVSVGKISGSVGTYSNVDPYVEEYVCRKLGLVPVSISTQIIQRDRIAQLMNTIAIIGASLEKIALEIRHLQRTEVLEVEEPFSKIQTGSSSMPHKKNPIICERICGLARILRSNSMAALENIALWHERDISHSSVERIIIPDSTILLDYMLDKMNFVISNLVVYPDKMKQNLKKTKGLIFSQKILSKLIQKGLSRTESYDIVQRLAMEAWDKELDFEKLVKEDLTIRKILEDYEVEECFDIKQHFKHIDTIFKKVGV